MDITLISKMVIDILSPALPFLLKVGENVTSDAAKKIGSDSWRRASEIWNQLSTNHSSGEKFKEACKDYLEDVKDPDAEAALRLSIKKILNEDRELLSHLSHKFENQSGINKTVTSSNSSISAGENIIGSKIVIGNRNRVG